jgi:hypothetical protein
VPNLPFTASLSGRLSQTTPDPSGHITITIDTRVSGAMNGSLVIVLRGSADGSGVSLESSAITFGPTALPGEYHGEVLLLEGDQLVASVRSPAGPPIDLGVLLRIDPTTGSVAGRVDAHAPSAVTSSGSGDDQDGNR